MICNSVPEGDCWIWIGRRSAKGYGTICMRIGGKLRTLYAHRVAFETLVGPIGEGLEIDHVCRVRHCINPAHLRAVPRIENLRNRGGMHAKNTRHP